MSKKHPFLGYFIPLCLLVYFNMSTFVHFLTQLSTFLSTHMYLSTSCFSRFKALSFVMRYSCLF